MGLRTNACSGKHRHKSLGAALAHLRSLVRRGMADNRMRPYPCPWCGHWHVGRAREQNYTKGTP